MSDPTQTKIPVHDLIVVGVDGSDSSQRALDFAADEAHRAGAVLQIVSVYTVVPAAGLIQSPNVLDKPGAEDVARRAMERVLQRRPGVVAKGEAVLGVPGPVLVDLSKNAALLVVGTRGHSMMVGVLLGSASEYVVHHAHCTTTVVR
jgi:nucleotide-binding universal stress UspA family protein